MRMQLFLNRFARVFWLTSTLALAYCVLLYVAAVIDEDSPPVPHLEFYLIYAAVLLPCFSSFAARNTREFVIGLIVGTITGWLAFAALMASADPGNHFAFAIALVSVVFLPGWLYWVMACVAYLVCFVLGQVPVGIFKFFAKREPA